MPLNKILRTAEEYHTALNEAHALVLQDPDDDTADAEHLDMLTLLINDYEQRVFQIDMPDPIDAIEFVMEQCQLKQKDLVPFIGSKSRVSEILNRKSPLTLPMIRALSKNLKIPVKVLVQEPQKPGDHEQRICM